jgi:alpha-ketoglutarate-dependent 2,4-dichlorophenoxyacetate dioxygenase
MLDAGSAFLAASGDTRGVVNFRKPFHAWKPEMALTFRKLHPLFAAEASSVDLRAAHDPEALAQIRAGMDQYAVLVFRDQPFTDDEQLAFAQRLDGVLHAKTGAAVLGKNRFGNEALADISNVDESGGVLQAGDRRRMYALGNRLWHTDASFQDPPGRYSMLSARVVPPVAADTEFADMRAAYDALDAQTRGTLEPLRVHHSIAYSRQTLGFEFSQEEQDRLHGAVHPLVRTIPRSGRRSLYLASHASRIVDWPLPEGRLLLHDLIEHATQREFVYRHTWRVGDLVIWDNRCTMHRARPFADTQYPRELRRVTTLDIGNA